MQLTAYGYEFLAFMKYFFFFKYCVGKFFGIWFLLLDLVVFKAVTTFEIKLSVYFFISLEILCQIFQFPAGTLCLMD